MNAPWDPGRALVALSLIVLAANSVGAAGGPGLQGPGASSVDRGRYLVSITGCHDCHSPKVGEMPDPERPLSGRPSTTQLPSKMEGEVHASLDLTAWTGPWGQSVASNLTPDPATGLATRYDEAKFIQTMRTGKKPSGLQLLPPMPSAVYQNLTDEDLKAIYAYLRSLKPIRNAVLTGIPTAAAPVPGKR